MNVGQGYKGPLGSNMSGAIINCYTDISGTGTCGFARRLTDAGIVSNSYSVSEGKAGAFFNQYGTNDTAGEGQLINTYWLETLDNSVIPESALVNSYSETKDYMKSLDFVSALNENKGENGVSWEETEIQVIHILVKARITIREVLYLQTNTQLSLLSLTTQ